jgi:uncharacterized membrane protein
VIIQPITGVLLANTLGWRLLDGWVALSLALYVLTGAFWVPVVWMQHKMRMLAEAAAQTDSSLPEEYHRLFRAWFLCGIPAFLAVLAIVWLMLARPAITLAG